MGVEGVEEGLWDKANQAGVAVLAFQLWKDLFVKVTAVAAFEITEFHDGEECAGLSQSRFSLKKQQAGQRGSHELVLALFARCCSSAPHDERAANARATPVKHRPRRDAESAWRF